MSVEGLPPSSPQNYHYEPLPQPEKKGKGGIVAAGQETSKQGKLQNNADLLKSNAVTDLTYDVNTKQLRKAEGFFEKITAYFGSTEKTKALKETLEALNSTIDPYFMKEGTDKTKIAAKISDYVDSIWIKNKEEISVKQIADTIMPKSIHNSSTLTEFVNLQTTTRNPNVQLGCKDGKLYIDNGNAVSRFFKRLWDQNDVNKTVMDTLKQGTGTYGKQLAPILMQHPQFRENDEIRKFKGFSDGTGSSGGPKGGSGPSLQNRVTDLTGTNTVGKVPSPLNMQTLEEYRPITILGASDSDYGSNEEPNPPNEPLGPNQAHKAKGPVAPGTEEPVRGVDKPTGSQGAPPTPPERI